MLIGLFILMSLAAVPHTFTKVVNKPIGVSLWILLEAQHLWSFVVINHEEEEQKHYEDPTKQCTHG